jgi:hypothetical protein
MSTKSKGSKESRVESIERMFFKHADDLAISIARSFARLEGRIDALETRVREDGGDLRDRLETQHANVIDKL